MTLQNRPGYSRAVFYTGFRNTRGPEMSKSFYLANFFCRFCEYCSSASCCSFFSSSTFFRSPAFWAASIFFANST